MSQSPRPEGDDEKQDKSPDTEGKEEGQQEMSHDYPPEYEVKEQDRWLPIANVARLMKTALPENAKIAKEAKECLQECVSEFISFITSEAAEKCQQEKRKTVNGEDIIFAMTSLGFENYSEALKIYLSRYRETLVARGDQKAGAGGQGGNASGGEYDTSNQDIMGGAMDNTQQGDYPYGVPGAAGDFQ
ncbi:histone-fold-containing protein [Elsinoe ampelina]|uniref:Histone-fold-containing protein n=1 Tax=Elsinoe ampelina TaxID=302913 RepID=A0A6A6GER6_9PEZI|nr:histone-fold-containing protein [Elsinoe ampelina]